MLQQLLQQHCNNITTQQLASCILSIKLIGGVRMKTHRRNVALAISIASLVFTLWRSLSMTGNDFILKAVLVGIVLLGIAIVIEMD